MEDLDYYRRLLRIGVGDRIEWYPGVTYLTDREFYSQHTSVKRGVVKSCFPRGKGASDEPFFTVTEDRTHMLFAVGYNNPTIKKLEID